MHWKRTYERISQLWENDHNKTAWLTTDPKYFGILQMAKLYLNINLVEEPEKQPTKPNTPYALKPAEWEKRQKLIPIQYFHETDKQIQVKLQ